MSILFKIASRERPKAFAQAMTSWVGNQRTRGVNYLVSLDANDPTLPRYTRVIERLRVLAAPMGARIEAVVGSSTGKIHALNRDIGQWDQPWDIVVLGSDDMVCQMEGWDSEVEQSMAQHFPGMDGALHYPDGNRRDLLTFSIMGRKMYDAFGYIYHPDYKSLWCDNEFHDSVRALGKCAFVDKNLVNHVHCTVKNGLPRDQLYVRNEALYSVDRAVYKRRKAHNFDVDRVRSVLHSS